MSVLKNLIIKKIVIDKIIEMSTVLNFRHTYKSNIICIPQNIFSIATVSYTRIHIDISYNAFASESKQSARWKAPLLKISRTFPQFPYLGISVRCKVTQPLVRKNTYYYILQRNKALLIHSRLKKKVSH